MIRLSFVSKEKYVCMRVCSNEICHKVLFLCIEIYNTHTATFLLAVLLWSSSLYISSGSEHEHTFNIRYQIFIRNNLCSMFNNASFTIIAVFFRNFFELCLYNTEDFLVASKKLFEEFDEGLNFFELVFNFLALKTCQFLKAHIENSNRLSL